MNDDPILVEQIYKILVMHGNLPKMQQTMMIMEILKPGLASYMNQPCYERGCPELKNDDIDKNGIYHYKRGE